MPERHVAYWAARRLTDESAAGVEAAVVLAREVLASRKLIADLRALEPERVTPGSLKHQGYMRALQRVRRLIEEAGL